MRTLTDHLRDGVLGAEGVADDIDTEHLLEEGRVEVCEFKVAADDVRGGEGGVVVEDVEPAERPDRLGHQVSDLVLLADVNAESDRGEAALNEVVGRSEGPFAV